MYFRTIERTSRVKTRYDSTRAISLQSWNDMGSTPVGMHGCTSTAPPKSLQLSAGSLLREWRGSCSAISLESLGDDGDDDGGYHDCLLWAKACNE